jgi:hypothetical protein
MVLCVYMAGLRAVRRGLLPLLVSEDSPSNQVKVAGKGCKLLSIPPADESGSVAPSLQVVPLCLSMSARGGLSVTDVLIP